MHNPFSITMKMDSASPTLFASSLGGSGPQSESLSFSYAELKVTYTDQER
jgi:type VI protein secretion system component Hcp